MEKDKKTCCHGNYSDKNQEDMQKEQATQNEEEQIREEEMKLQAGLSKVENQEKSN